MDNHLDLAHRDAAAVHMAEQTYGQLAGPVTDHGGHAGGRLSSWLLVATVVLAAAVAGIAMITHAWILFWICAALIILAIPIGAAIHIMDDAVL